MPELPEVETTTRGINSGLRGLIIRDVWSAYESALYKNKNHIKDKNYFKIFKKEIVGKKILSAERRAKNILINLSGGKTLLIHMKMTGHLLYGKYKKTKIKIDPWKTEELGPLQDPFNRFIRLVFSLSNGKHLCLSDVRKFAKVTLLQSKDILESSELNHLGPEPLEKTFTATHLKERLLKKPKGKIKQVLMDQTIISGIGNIYSDEILWKSDVHPLSVVQKIPAKNIKLIWKNIKTILRKGIDFKGDSMSDYRNIDGKPGKFQNEHNAYRKTGMPCSKRSCHGLIHKLKVGGRSAHFCNLHQKLYA